MRGFKILLVAALVAIGIGVGVEAANVATGGLATLKGGLNSLGTSPYLEARFSLSEQGAPQPPALADISLVVAAESADGHTVINADRSEASEDIELTVMNRADDLGDIRIVGGSHVYFRIFPSRVAKVAGVPKSADDTLSLIGTLLGGEWFAVPADLAKGLSKSAIPSAELGGATPQSLTPAQTKSVIAAEKKLQNDLLQITKIRYTPLAGGQDAEATATIRSLGTVFIDDVGPLMTSLTKLPPASIASGIASVRHSAATATGRVVAHAITDGAGVMTAGSVAVTQGRQSALISASIRHDAIDLGKPVGVRTLPQSVIHDLQQELKVPSLD